MLINPLVRESWRGSRAAGEAQLNYLLHLLFQGVVLFVWWPKDSLAQTLAVGHAPGTLVAACTAVGISLSYFSLRAGAEEIRLGGQQGLRDWAVLTDLGTARVATGYVAGFGLHLGLMLSLSMPIIAAGYACGGGSPAILGYLLVVIMAQASFFRLLAAVTYLAMGHRGVMTFLGLRAAFVAVLLGGAVAAPSMSLFSVSRKLVHGVPDREANGAAIAPHLAFIAAYGVATVVLFALLCWLLARLRRCSNVG